MSKELEFKDIEEAIKKDRTEIVELVETKFREAVEEAKKSDLSEEATKALKDGLMEEITTKMDDHQKSVEGQFSKVQEQVDKLDVASQKRQVVPRDVGIKEAINIAFDKKAEEIKGIISAKSQKEIELGDYSVETKDHSSAVDFGANVYPVTENRNIIYDPARSVRVRELLTTIPTSTLTSRFLLETAQIGNHGMVAEGATKPELRFQLGTQDVIVRKIAGHMRVPDEMLEDLPQFQAYLTIRGLDDLRDTEDAQLLTGDGLGQNLTGIIPNASAYVDSLADPLAQEYDVLSKAVDQVTIARYRATAALVGLGRVGNIRLIKDTQGRYLLPNVYTGTIGQVAGVPIIGMDALADNTFLVGAFNQAMTLLDRRSATVRFYDQDRDNAITNMVTIVIEERLALAITRPAAIVANTDFDQAIIDARA